MDFLYSILPAGNEAEFPELDAELRRREVMAEWCEYGGGRVYRIAVRDLDRLPRDGYGPYLGDDNSGHGLSLLLLSDTWLSRLGEWTKI